MVSPLNNQGRKIQLKLDILLKPRLGIRVKMVGGDGTNFNRLGSHHPYFDFIKWREGIAGGGNDYSRNLDRAQVLERSIKCHRCQGSGRDTVVRKLLQVSPYPFVYPPGAVAIHR